MTLLSLTPTFTQGLIIGQLSILLLLAFVLRYLFFESGPPAQEDDDDNEDGKPPESTPIRAPRRKVELRGALNASESEDAFEGPESVEWFNFLIANITETYRSDLRRGLPGATGDDAARTRVEKWARDALTSTFMAPVKIHSINLGTSAPRLSNARIVKPPNGGSPYTEMDVTYTDSISLSLSTSLLFNYPTMSFARLPISLSLSLSVFSAVMTLTPPSSTTPSFSLSLRPDFSLSLNQSSLMGSRGKLSDVPKVHQLIEDRIRSVLRQKASVYRVLLPGIGIHQATAPGTEKREVDVIVE